MAHRTASTALPNSASTLSPAVLAIRPRWEAINSSRMARRSVKSQRVPTSSAPIRRLYPSTSAAKIATSLRSASIGLAKIRSRPTVIINVPYAIVSCIRTGSLIRMVQTNPAPLRVATSGRFVLSNNRADMLAAQSWLQQFRLQSVDDLELFHLPGVGQEVDHDPVERKRRQVARPQLGHGDLLDELGVGIDLRVGVVEPVHVLDQGVGGATIALGEQEGAGVGAVGWDAPKAGRMLPNRERRVAVADHTRGRFDEEGQHVPENLRRNGNHALRRQQCAEEVGVAEGINDAQLSQHAGRHAEINTDGGHVAAARPSAGSDHQLELAERVPDRVDERVDGLLAIVDD